MRIYFKSRASRPSWSYGPTIALLCLTALIGAAAAHGINGHIWTTDGGVDVVADCSLGGWLAQDEYREIVQIGAAYPDTGYATDAGREYGETAHWEPFVQAYIEYLREHFGPPYEDPEARKRVAFLMGLAAHGMEDEVFDSIFMHKAAETEGSNQEILDPGTDFMLIQDGYTDLRPDMYLPGEKELLAVFATPGIDVKADYEVMLQGMFIVRTIVIGLVNTRESMIENPWRDLLPWTSQYYVDPWTPGSLAYEKWVIGPYFDAIWARLHGEIRMEDVVIQTVPLPGSPMASTDHTSVDSWISLIFGHGVWNETLTKETVRLFDPQGEPVDVRIAYTRWGGKNDAGRLVHIRPKTDMVPDVDYTVVFGPGIRLIDGTVTEEALTFTFRSACSTVPCTQPQTYIPPSQCPVEAEPVDEPIQPAPSASAGCNSSPTDTANALSWLFALAFLIALKVRKHSARSAGPGGVVGTT